jgi:hypothetical protein
LEVAGSKSSWREFTRGQGTKLKNADVAKLPNKGQQTESEDKLATLKAFRCRNGLCFKCGEKWNRNHKCPAHISLHVLEELLEAMDIVQLPEEDENEVDIHEEEQLVLTV